MKNPLRTLTHAALLTLLLSLTVIAQEQDKPMPDRWRSLVLNESTPEDAIHILGQPQSDKLSDLPVRRINNWITKTRKEKVFKRLKFNKPEGMDAVELYFLSDKLVMIQLDTKDLKPNSLSGVYGIEFRPMVSGADEGWEPKDFERNQGRVYPKTYPTVYHMVAVAEKSFICAMIGNSSFGSVLRKSAKIGDSEGDYPGGVMFLQLISRKLENRDGADALK
jgi:hypothetical protein